MAQEVTTGSVYEQTWARAAVAGAYDGGQGGAELGLERDDERVEASEVLDLGLEVGDEGVDGDDQLGNDPGDVGGGDVGEESGGERLDVGGEGVNL